MGLSVAVIGLSPSHDFAPWDDSGWQKWGLAWDPYAARLDRRFEMHDIRLLESEHSRRRPEYLDSMDGVYMQEAYFPGAIVYPFDDVAKTTGGYWNSSIAYVMALAIHEGADQIALYGVDMNGDDEYGYQRPNMEYLIGLARGKGIEVSIPEGSSLCKFQNKGIRFYQYVPEYVDRYGWLGHGTR